MFKVDIAAPPMSSSLSFSGNWGVGTNIPNEQLHISAGNGLVSDNSFISLQSMTQEEFITCPYCGFQTPYNKSYCGQDTSHGCGAVLGHLEDVLLKKVF